MEQTKSKGVWSALVIGLKLLLICAIIAGVVSFVYTLTHDKYEENKAATKAEAIGAIFGFTDQKPLTDVLAEEEGTVVYSVADPETKQIIGFCVEVIEPSGYGGDMTMMVGYGADGLVCGVEIISHSETPGLGSKVEGEAFRVQFEGKATVDYSTVDAISGATYSSKAVTAGVNRATKALYEAMKGGALGE